MLTRVLEKAKGRIKTLAEDTSLTDKERCAKLHVYLTQVLDNPQIRVQTEASCSQEGQHYHVLFKAREDMVPRFQAGEQVRYIFTYTKDGEVVQS